MATKQTCRLDLEILERREVPSGAQVTVMSENVYMGDDTNLFAAGTASALGGPSAAIPAWTSLWSNVTTHLQERAKAIANEIVSSKPALIGLQEADRYWTVPLNPLSAPPQTYDFLQILQQNLQGVPYQVVDVTPGMDLHSPGYVQGALQEIHVNDRVAILVRKDVYDSGAISNPQGNTFFTQIPLPVPILGLSTVERGWDAVDVAYGGHNCRFINMCLEIGAFPAIQAQQVGELLSGPAATSLPVILVGDSNTNANPDPNAGYLLTYSLLTGDGGFKDAWLQTNPNDPGITWGNQPDLRNQVSLQPDNPDPNHQSVRGSLVLFRGPIQATSMIRVGVHDGEKTSSGLWPSDHAGVVATLNVADSQPQSLFAVGTDSGSPEVKVFDARTGTLRFDFFAYSPFFTGGVRVAVGDINGDGVPDIVTTPGPGYFPEVKVFDGTSGALVRDFFAFDPSFLGGLTVAVGDFNHDGYADIVVGMDAGGLPWVRSFSGKDYSSQFNFLAYTPLFSGGVRVAVGDINGDGYADLITAPGSSWPEIKVFSGKGGALLQDYFFLPAALPGGVWLAAGDLNGDGLAEVIVGAGLGSAPEVGVFSGGTATLLSDFFAYSPVGWFSGVHVGVSNVRFDGRGRLLVAPGPGHPAEVKGLDGLSLAVLDDFFAYDPGFLGGVFISGNP